MYTSKSSHTQVKSHSSVINFFLILLCSCFSTTTIAKTGVGADAILGKWRAQSIINGEEAGIVEFKKLKKNGTYYGRLVSVNKKHTHYLERCHKTCPKRFKNKPLLGMVIMWNVKAKNPKKPVYTGGYGINPWQGKMFRGGGKIIGRSKNVLQLRGTVLESSWIGQSFSFTRVVENSKKKR